MCCTRPPHVSVAPIFEISRYMYISNALLISFIVNLYKYVHMLRDVYFGLFNLRDMPLFTKVMGSKTLICISFTKLNIHLLLERVFLNFSGYSLTVTQTQANATKRLHKFRNRSHFSRDAKRIYEKTYHSHASSVASTVTMVFGFYLSISINAT
ncbi:hypothetical protein CSKR_101344 [Clonorchis sinensis]|uniref:Uncharacterized protein n=1 Tax=Clonorchis sinensis TaxID=79923 RepID=A0A3R7FRU7_CLOSI|nr:hypothetical protein CSKR_101344 [Clonorchis sinensis]